MDMIEKSSFEHWLCGTCKGSRPKLRPDRTSLMRLKFAQFSAALWKIVTHDPKLIELESIMTKRQPTIPQRNSLLS